MTEVGLLPAILRDWRRVMASPMSLVDVAEAISALPGAKPVKFQTVGAWESGTGRPGIARLRELDQVYGASGTLVALGIAASTPAAVPPRVTWRLMLHGSSTGPVWAWIRSALPGPIDVQLSVGPFRSSTHGPDAGVRGFLVVSPVSTSLQPVGVNLGVPGWVDVGRGDIPPELGFEIFDPATPAAYQHRLHGSIPKPAAAVAAFRQRLARHDQIGLNELDVESDRLNLRQHLDRLILEVTPRDQAPTDFGITPQEPLPETWAVRQIRDGRGLSLAEVAGEVSAMRINLAGEPDAVEQVTPRVIRDFEANQSVRAKFLSARLDVAYSVAGLLADDPVTVQCPSPADRDKRGAPRTIGNIRYRLDFPVFWVGPIWVHFLSEMSSPDEVEVELMAYPWHKFIRLRSGQTLTTRRLWPRPGRPDPLFVETPPGWSITAGMGERAGAANVERGWTVVDIAGQTQLMAELARGTHRYLATMLARSRRRPWLKRRRRAGR